MTGPELWTRAEVCRRLDIRPQTFDYHRKRTMPKPVIQTSRGALWSPRAIRAWWAARKGDRTLKVTLDALDRHDGNVTLAARDLGVDRRTVQRRVAKLDGEHGIDQGKLVADRMADLQAARDGLNPNR